MPSIRIDIDIITGIRINFIVGLSVRPGVVNRIDTVRVPEPVRWHFKKVTPYGVYIYTHTGFRCCSKYLNNFANFSDEFVADLVVFVAYQEQINSNREMKGYSGTKRKTPYRKKTPYSKGSYKKKTKYTKSSRSGYSKDYTKHLFNGYCEIMHKRTSGTAAQDHISLSIPCDVSKVWKLHGHKDDLGTFNSAATGCLMLKGGRVSHRGRCVQELQKAQAY